MNSFELIHDPEEAARRRQETKEDYLERLEQAIENGGTPRASVENLKRQLQTEQLDG